MSLIRLYQLEKNSTLGYKVCFGSCVQLLFELPFLKSRLKEPGEHFGFFISRLPTEFSADNYLCLILCQGFCQRICQIFFFINHNLCLLTLFPRPTRDKVFVLPTIFLFQVLYFAKACSVWAIIVFKFNLMRKSERAPRFNT